MNYINLTNPTANITKAKMRFNKLLKVSFILENGTIISMSEHANDTPINI